MENVETPPQPECCHDDKDLEIKTDALLSNEEFKGKIKNIVKFMLKKYPNEEEFNKAVDDFTKVPEATPAPAPLACPYVSRSIPSEVVSSEELASMLSQLPSLSRTTIELDGTTIVSDAPDSRANPPDYVDFDSAHVGHDDDTPIVKKGKRKAEESDESDESEDEPFTTEEFVKNIKIEGDNAIVTLKVQIGNWDYRGQIQDLIQMITSPKFDEEGSLKHKLKTAVSKKGIKKVCLSLNETLEDYCENYLSTSESESDDGVSESEEDDESESESEEDESESESKDE